MPPIYDYHVNAKLVWLVAVVDEIIAILFHNRNIQNNWPFDRYATDQPANMQKRRPNESRHLYINIGGRCWYLQPA